MNTLSYIRFSAEQIADSSMCHQRQKEAIETMCSEAGATIIGEFEDMGSSSKAHRPGLAALYSFIQGNPGKVQAIATVSGDRLFRNYPAYYEFSQWIEELGIQLMIVHHNPFPALFIQPDYNTTKQRRRRR